MLSAHTAIVSWVLVLVLETADKWRLISTDHLLIAPHFISQPTSVSNKFHPKVRYHQVNYHKGQAAIRHYGNQPAHPL